MSDNEWQHAGAYPTKLRANDYAQNIASKGMEIKITSKEVWDVWTRRKP